MNATKALAIDDNDAFIHAAAALAYTLCGDHDSGEAHAKRALELNINENWVTYACGMVFTYLGRLDDAIKWLQRAVRSDPRVTENWKESLVECHYMRRDYVAALEVFKTWSNIPFHMCDVYAACYAQLGDMENACKLAQTYRQTVPEGFDIAKNREAHMRMMKRQADREHWIEGFHKAGV